MKMEKHIIGKVPEHTANTLANEYYNDIKSGSWPLALDIKTDPARRKTILQLGPRGC